MWGKRTPENGSLLDAEAFALEEEVLGEGPPAIGEVLLVVDGLEEVIGDLQTLTVAMEPMRIHNADDQSRVQETLPRRRDRLGRARAVNVPTFRT